MVETVGSFRRAVVLAVGSAGDVAPLVAVATRLVARGLQTTLLAPQRYGELVTGTGVEFASIGADDVFAEVFDGADLWTANRGLAASWRYYGAAMRTGLTILRRGWNPADTVLVSSSFAVAARLAQECDGFTNTTVHLSPSLMFSRTRPPRWPASSIPPGWPRWLQHGLVSAAERWMVDPVIGAEVNPFRAQLGLPPQRRLFSEWIHSPHRVAYAFPEWLALAADDWPAQGVYTGFPQWPGPIRALPSEIEAFLHTGSGPIVVVTAGTAVASRPGWVDRVSGFALAQGARVIVIGADSNVPMSSTSLCQVRFAPFETLLPHVQLVVHHGGIGTAAEALRAGVPQWLVPTAHDQPDNADRLQRLGLAYTIVPAARAEALAQAWRWALGEPQLVSRLKAAQARMMADCDGADRIAELALDRMTDPNHPK